MGGCQDYVFCPVHSEIIILERYIAAQVLFLGYFADPEFWSIFDHFGQLLQLIYMSL